MGKHAKQQTHPHKTAKLASAIAVSGAVAIGVPLATATSAHAVTMPEWQAIAQCESAGNWSINYSSDGLSVGGLQFQNPSWQDALQYLTSKGYNVSGWTQTLRQDMPVAQVPNEDETILAGEALLAEQDNPWAADWGAGGFGDCITDYPYLAQSQSMFLGGPNPWGLPGTTAPADADTTGGSAAPPVATAPPATGNTAASDAAAREAYWKATHPSAVTPPTAPAGTVVDNKYTVASGDYLAKIAQQQYGNWRLWPLVYDINKSVIGSDPNVIQVGMVLTLPELGG